MFRVRDIIGKEIDTEFWLEEDEDRDAIFLKAKLTTDQQSATIARIDGNGMMIYESFYKDFGFKTVKKENGRSSINVYYVCAP